MKSKLTIFTKLLLDIMFYGGIAVTATLPISIGFYAKFNERVQKYYLPMVIIFLLCGILALLIIFHLRKMFATVLADDCFVEENVVSLDKMGNYSFCIAIVTIARFFLYLTPSVFIIILTFVIAGLFSKVLSHVFDRAVSYKLENDLTI